MAISVNTVLTSAYKAIYSCASPLGYTDEDSLALMVAPLSACTEVTALYEKGVIDATTAIPAALHSLGCSSSEIANALRRRKDIDKEEALKKESESEGKTSTLNADITLKAAQAKVAQANASKLEREAKEPYKEPASDPSNQNES